MTIQAIESTLREIQFALSKLENGKPNGAISALRFAEERLELELLNSMRQEQPFPEDWLEMATR